MNYNRNNIDRNTMIDRITMLGMWANQSGDGANGESFAVAPTTYTPDGQEVPPGWSYREIDESSVSCGENQLEIVGNCIDRSAVIILGAVALYLLLSKNPMLKEKIG
tara:strand:+ start:539 stop:859 length:321 start_codon:yes stop_codon:yes gene_type:complete